MRRITQLTIELTENDLQDRSGLILAQIDDVRSVERGIFAFKATNVFTPIKSPAQDCRDFGGALVAGLAWAA